MTITPQPDAIVVDLTGIGELPRQLLERVSQAQSEGLDLEILNPSPEVLEYLREADLGRILIRGSNSP